MLALASSCQKSPSISAFPWTRSLVWVRAAALWIMAACVTARTSWMAFKTALAQLLDFTAEKISQVVRDED